MKRKRLISVNLIMIVLLIVVMTFVGYYQSAKWKEVQITLDPSYNELLSADEMKTKGHISVCSDYVTKDSIGYNNEDGTKTIYVYASQINVETENGLTQIDSRIKNTTDSIMRSDNYFYTVSNNDIKPYYNKEFSDECGLLLKKGNFHFEITQKNKRSGFAEYQLRENFIKEKKYMITYENVIDDATLRFYPSSIGSNCELDYRKLQDKEFVFDITVSDPNIKLIKEKGGYIVLLRNKKDIYNNTTSDVVGVIQRPLIRNAEGKVSCENEVDFKKIRDDRYELLFRLDESFVGGNALVYISFEMRREKQPDTTIYSYLPDLTNNYLCNYAVIGNSGIYGIGRHLIRYNFVKYFDFKSQEIEQVKYHLYTLTENQGELELLPVLEDWCSITGNWNNNYKTGGTISLCNVFQEEVVFDITEEVKKWCDAENGQLEHNGVMLKMVAEKKGVYYIILSNDNALFKSNTEIIIKGEKK